LVEIVSFLACTSFLVIQSRREIQAANEGECEVAAALACVCTLESAVFLGYDAAYVAYQV
jgi:hypothetical protein